MSAQESNGPVFGNGTAGPHEDGGDRSAGHPEHPEQSEVFRSFVQGSIHDDDPHARPGWSRLAIASLVPGVIGFLWPLGLLLGIAALLRIRRTKQSGRWAAVTGLVLCTTWAIVGTSVFGDGTSDDQHVRTVSGYDLRVGDCFGLQPSEANLASEVTAVPCAQPHHGEVFATADMGDAINGGAAERADGAREACAAAAKDRKQGRAVPASVRIDVLLPLGNTLTARPHRTVICAFVDSAAWTGRLGDGATAPEL
ncbi:DUF4190 domain-containing protein [Kitasatospora sp. NPDC057015]|uniref:DUF4190 domain-containing protein n=1 Tax=Kitasatospora sp. NPDC057015 TaxID=3346001 RepID=UPI0036428DEE